MAILRATVVRESQCSKGKSHKDPLANLIKCDENERPGLCVACDLKETEERQKHLFYLKR